MLQILIGTSVAAIQGETCQQMYGFLANKTIHFKVTLLCYFKGLQRMSETASSQHKPNSSMPHLQ